jgi:hypothetical protein
MTKTPQVPALPGMTPLGIKPQRWTGPNGMTREQALALANWDHDYTARRHRDGTWGVWDRISAHWLEFDLAPDAHWPSSVRKAVRQ